MALKYYMDEFDLPDDCTIVRDNRKYFIDVTMDKLDNRVDGLLTHTDKAKYIDGLFFKDRFGHDLPWRCLSSGGMTVLNIYYNPDVIFETPECEFNAINDILLLNQGSVYDMGIPSMFDESDIDVYVINGDNSKLYTKYSELKEDYA